MKKKKLQRLSDVQLPMHEMEKVLGGVTAADCEAHATDACGGADSDVSYVITDDEGNKHFGGFCL